MLWNQNDVGMTLRYQEIESAARTLGVKIQALAVRDPGDFEAAFAAMARNRPDAIFLVADPLTTSNRKRVVDFAALQRIPAMYDNSRIVEDGGLMAYGPSFEDGYRRIAYYVDRILKGANPSELPMEQPTRFYLLINQKTARSLGLTIPESILFRADKVIE